MKLFLAWTIVCVLGVGSGSRLALAEGAGLKGLPFDAPATANAVKAALDPCRKPDEGGLKLTPTLTDQQDNKTSVTATNDTIKTVERKVFNNTDETGHETGNKTVVEKITETDLKPNGSVSKTTETKVVLDEEGKESGEKTVTESETLTETTPDNGTVTQTVDLKKVTDAEGNEIDEEVVIKKQTTVQPLANATKGKPQGTEEESKVSNATLTPKKEGTDNADKNKTEAKLGASVPGKSDEPQKIERIEKTKEILPGNKTNEILVKEKEEKLPSQESIKETSVESKNVTDKGDAGIDVEKETVIQKEVEKKTCKNDTEEVHDKKHHNETNDLRHLVDEAKSKINEEKAKAKEINATASQGIDKGNSNPDTQQCKVVKKVVPAVTQEKVVEVVPSVTAGNIPVVTREKVVEQLPPSVTEAIISVPKKQEKVPVVAKGKVVEKVVPSVTEGKVPLVTKVEQTAPSVTEAIVTVPKEERKVVEKVVPSVTEEKVPVVTQKVAEKVIPSVTEGEVPAVTQEKVIEKVVPSVTEENVPVVIQKVVEQSPLSVTEGKVPAVAQEKVIEKVIPSRTEEKVPVVTLQKVAQQAAPKKAEKIVTVPAQQEKAIVVTQPSPAVTQEKVPVVTQQKDLEKVVPSLKEEKVPVVIQEKVLEKSAPSVKETVVSVPMREVVESVGNKEITTG